MTQKNDLLENLDKVKTTQLGVERIRKNLRRTDIDVVGWCKEQIRKADHIVKEGKNWYVQIEDAIITVNASSYTIITAHKAKKSSIKKELMEDWVKEEEQYSLIGWDFSYVAGRWVTENMSWDYGKIVKSYLKNKDILLDMGTGGGEFLLTLEHPYKKTYVTEAYLPNVEWCKSKLAPLGINVTQTFDDDRLPFDNEYFDIIINRHESFGISEVSRTLKPGGYFITQQVGADNLFELRTVLNGEEPVQGSMHDVKSYADGFHQLGFHIVMENEVKLSSKFFDVGAVIFYGKACEWEVPNFSVETHLDQLWEIQQEIDKKGFFQGTETRFILVARKLS